MSILINTPTHENGINFLMSNLICKQKYVDNPKTVYAINKADGFYRIPLAFYIKLLGSQNIKTYEQLERRYIKCNVELGYNGDGKNRDHQLIVYPSMLCRLVNEHCLFLSLFCGAGKTIMAIKAICDLGLKTGILTDGKSIFPQWINALNQYTGSKSIVAIRGINDLIKDKETGKYKLPDGYIYVFMATIASKLHTSLLESIKFLIVDEATYFFTPVKCQSIMNFTPSYVLGLCAEIERNDGTHFLLDKIFGHNPIRMISQKKFIVYKVNTPYKPDVPAYNRRTNKNTWWGMVIKSISENELRNNEIVSLVSKLSGRIIVACKRKNQANYIHDKLKELKLNVQLLMGNKNTFNNCDILVGIMSKMGKGVDPKNLCADWEGEPFDKIVLAADTCKPEQIVGRIFRGLDPIVYDLVDDQSTLKKHFKGPCVKPNIPRLKWYNDRNAIIKPITLKALNNMSNEDIEHMNSKIRLV